MSGIRRAAVIGVERLEVKEALYRATEEHRTPGTPVSSNTSTSLLARIEPTLVTGKPLRM